MLVLNIAGGKVTPMIDTDEPTFTINVDTSYFSKTDPLQAETEVFQWLDKPKMQRSNKIANLNYDIFEFMERTILSFDYISIYRFLEHVSFTQVEYFIYLVSTITEKESIVDVIVPDYTILAEMILNESNGDDYNNYDKFQNHNTVLTTELLNEPSCPHASIWTTYRMKRFWELEKRFRVIDQRSGYKFDGRDIYLRSFMERI